QARAPVWRWCSRWPGRSPPAAPSAPVPGGPSRPRRRSPTGWCAPACARRPGKSARRRSAAPRRSSPPAPARPRRAGAGPGRPICRRRCRRTRTAARACRRGAVASSIHPRSCRRKFLTSSAPPSLPEPPPAPDPAPPRAPPHCPHASPLPSPLSRLPSPPMLIRDWPANERPREKMVARGASALSDAELLAIFLGSGLRGQDAVATARALLAAHGPLRALLERSPGELAALPGLGPARACQLTAALELCDRFLAAGLEGGEALPAPAAAGRYFAQRLRGQPCEVFAALFLDTRHRALAFEELFRGTVDGAEVHPREVVRH